MGITLAEKILARASGRQAVKAGDVLEPGGPIPYTRQRLLHQVDRP